MRRLSPRVNVIPCIGKADGLTPSELAAFKKRVSLLPTLTIESQRTECSRQIMEDIEYYGIPVYNFPYDVEEDDEDTIADNSELRVSNTSFKIDLVLTSVPTGSHALRNCRQ